MERELLIKRLMATFLEELDEHVRILNQELLTLEKNAEEGRAERLKVIFRSVHSLKGAARAVNVGIMEEVCHGLEEILVAAQRGGYSIGPSFFSLLFGAADALEEAGMRLREQHDLKDSVLAGLLPQIQAVVGTLGAETPPASDKPNLGADSEKPVQGSSSSAVETAEAEEALPETRTSSAIVRVPAEKLDSLLAQSGELLGTRRRVWSRTDEVTALKEFVSRWKTDWQSATKKLKKLLPGPEKGKLGVARDSNGAMPALPRRVVESITRTGRNIQQLEKDLDSLFTGLGSDCRSLDHAATGLDDEIHRLRMLPFAEACQGLERVIRDLTQAGGKEINLVVEGAEIELDRSILEGLKDPLRHLVRNAVDHAIESVEERRAVGKSSAGRITIAAHLRGNQLEIAVSDDGRGIDLEGLRQQLRRKNISEPADERDLARLVFVPGLSTSKLITDVSGRGMGLDVVKSRVEALHGTVDLSFAPGRGTAFTLLVPLTLTTLRAVLVTVGGRIFAVPGSNVAKLVRVIATEFRTIEGRPMLSLGGVPLPVVSLAEMLGLPFDHVVPGRKIPVLVAGTVEKRMGFIVDEFSSEQEVVIKSLGSRIRRIPYVSGATLLPSGGVALVLNTANLIRSALTHVPRSMPQAAAQTVSATRKRILIAEDSVTTRTLEKSILEAAGYDVLAAVDGAAAWQLLQDRGADLVVSDIEMPRMDGFVFTETIRASKRFRDLPVILVTARETDADKARGIEVGANAYLLKSAFDQKNLLETIAQLL